MYLHSLSFPLRLSCFAVLSGLLLLPFVLSSSAEAQQFIDPENVREEKFDSWTVLCADVPEQGNREFCEMRQLVTVSEQDAVGLASTLGYLDEEKTQLGGLFIAPLGILLQAGVIFQVDQDDKLETPVPVTLCQRNGCYINVAFNEEWLAGMRKGTTLNVTYYSPDNQPVTVGVSLKGFTAAVNRISR